MIDVWQGNKLLVVSDLLQNLTQEKGMPGDLGNYSQYKGVENSVCFCKYLSYC
jgi:hypothetical protein